ncbi:Protein M3 [Ceratobasidium sp. 370]|nr:Protein M3 [Ceratobasidium sp. 370]
MELFGAVAAKGASQLLLKVFWVPRQFRNGILVAGACNNWGDLPTAVVTTVTAYAPFSSGDSDVAVAYISISILIGFAALFPLGGHRLIARDFADVDTSADAGDAPESVVSRLCDYRSGMRTLCGKGQSADLEKDGCQPPIDEKRADISPVGPQSPTKDPCLGHREVPEDSVEHSKRDSSNSTDAEDSTVVPNLPAHAKSPSLTSSGETPLPAESKDIALAIPPTISIVVGIIIAVIPTLKALFIPPSPDSHVHVGTAPDGLPPLHVLFDTATFIGGGSIPLGLVCLGSALARLEVPKPFSRAPLGAISAFSILKARHPMVIGPVFGVLVVEALTHHTALIDPNDEVLRFVCMYLAGSPTATTQARRFTLPVLVTMTALSAYALNILF